MTEVTDSNNNNQESCCSEDPEDEDILLRKGLHLFKVEPKLLLKTLSDYIAWVKIGFLLSTAPTL